jgi:hypothetical protein
MKATPRVTREALLFPYQQTACASEMTAFPGLAMPFQDHQGVGSRNAHGYDEFDNTNY